MPVKLFSLFLIGVLMISVLLFWDDNPVTFQSLESQTIDGRSVYNTIAFYSNSKQDVWMMNQSHHGVNAQAEQWDRLAIVVDKSTSPNEVLFLQLPPGTLQWSDSLISQGIDNKVSCFQCHSNGPRLIREDKENSKLSINSKLKILAWNLRIKSYGPLKESPLQDNSFTAETTPFRHQAKIDNEILAVQSCTKCHHGRDELLARNPLTRQNSLAISFMMQNNLMPPLGFSVSQEDKEQIQRFIQGL
jgi:hypothetical protein